MGLKKKSYRPLTSCVNFVKKAFCLPSLTKKPNKLERFYVAKLSSWSNIFIPTIGNIGEKYKSEIALSPFVNVKKPFWLCNWQRSQIS